MQNLNAILSRIKQSNGMVVVAGLGKSGLAASLLLKEQGYRVMAIDENVSDEILYRADILHQSGIDTCLGLAVEEKVKKASLLVVSPGIAPSSPVISKALESGIPVASEIDLAWVLKKTKPKMTLAITGTNGKTTVTTLLKFLLEQAGYKTILGGNVGDPLSQYATEITEDTFLVLEVSSFQLYFSFNFEPDVAAILNITPDHLDWHRDFDDYVQSKKHLIELLKDDGWLVLNLDDPVVATFEPFHNQKLIWFSLKRNDLPNMAYYNGKDAVLKINNQEVLRIERSLFKAIGNHNTENLLTALSLAWIAGIDQDQIRKYLPEYRLEPHRLQEVGRLGPIVFIDDSKATNSDASKRAVESFNGERLICLLGGRAKEKDFTELVRSLKDAKAVAVLFGEARNVLAEQLSMFGVAYFLATNLKEATEVAFRLALGESAGEKTDFETELNLLKEKLLPRLKERVVVLLSPACASFDEFSSYHERGEKFKEYILGFLAGVSNAE
jgi:UDP-N-acetylmuramoylalanine--D-glutamate ligase